MNRVWIAQCLCPQRHAILASAGEAEDREAAEAAVLSSLRDEIAALLSDGSINPWCGLCKSPSASWTYELGRTRFRSIEEATPELMRSEVEQALARALLGDGDRQREVKPMKRSDYTWRDHGDVLLIFDENGAVSVTNDIEQVIRDLAATGLNLDGRRVIYRDSEGRWDGVATRSGEFVGFVMLGARTVVEAMTAARTSTRWEPACLH